MKYRVKYEYYLDEVRQFSFVISQLTKREIKRKYSRTFIGVFWSVLQPLFTMIIMALVFTKMFNRVENYPMYLLTGTTIFNFFSGATNSALTSLVDNKNLLIKIKFPHILFPISRVLTNVVNYLYTLLAYVLLMVFYNIDLSVTMLYFPIVMFFLILFIVGVGLILSVLYVFFGDIKHLYSVFLTLVMYCSAIFYPIDNVSTFMKRIIVSNPIFNYIVIIRNCLLYNILPTNAEVTRMILWGGGIFSIGIFIFYKARNKVIQSI